MLWIILTFIGLCSIPLGNRAAVAADQPGGFVIWLILVLKAYQGQMFKLPVIGDLAEQQAGA